MAGIIATGVSDPDFYSHQASRLAGAISSIAGGWRQRQEEKAAADQAEISRAFQLMQQAPELADTWGQELVKKYGATHPEVPAMVSVIQNRKALAQEIPAAGSAWEAAVQKRKDDHAAAQARAASLPDYVDSPDPGGMFVPGPQGIAINLASAIAPNVEKKKELARLAQVDPAYFSSQALEDLPVHQADQARLYAKEHGIPIQQATPFDPYKDLPPTERGLEAVRSGLIPGESEAAAALRIGSKLVQDPATIQQQGFQRSEREARQAEQERMLGVRDTKLRERMSLSEKIAAAREDRHMADQKSLIDYRAEHRVGGAGGRSGQSDLSHKDIVAGSKSVAKDYDEERKAALTGLSGADRIAALQKFQADHGPRPKIITPYAAKQITAMADDDADAQDMAETLSQAVTNGHDEGSVLTAFRKAHASLVKGDANIAPSGASPAAPKAAPKLAPGKPASGAAAKPVGAKRGAMPPEDVAIIRQRIKMASPGLKPIEIEALVKKYIKDRS